MGDTLMPDDAPTVTRASRIVYITEWAARYGAVLQPNGEVGFGRPCAGVLKGDHYVDTGDVKYGGEWWEPEDAYHKHDCVAVLIHDDGQDAALAQLCEWVRWLDGHGYGIEEVGRQPFSDIDLLFHGVTRPRLVRLSGQEAAHA
jgi:hypothetical protein